MHEAAGQPTPERRGGTTGRRTTWIGIRPTPWQGWSDRTPVTGVARGALRPCCSGREDDRTLGESDSHTLLTGSHITKTTGGQSSWSAVNHDSDTSVITRKGSKDPNGFDTLGQGHSRVEDGSGLRACQRVSLVKRKSCAAYEVPPPPCAASSSRSRCRWRDAWHSRFPHTPVPGKTSVEACRGR